MSAQNLLDLARSGASFEEQSAALPELLHPLLVPGIVLRGEGAGRSVFGGDGPVLNDAPNLTFVAAVDLAEVPHLDPLPRAGTLRFYWDFEFYDRPGMDFVVASRVLHDPGPPPEVPGGTPLTGLAIPIVSNFGGLSRDEFDQVEAVLDDLFENVYEHQLLGASRDIQGPVLAEVPYWFVEGLPETRDRYSDAELAGEGWALLAEFDSSGDLMFGDAGAVYYVLPEADLRAQRFDRVMGIMQCA